MKLAPAFTFGLTIAVMASGAIAKGAEIPFDTPATKAFAERVAADVKSGKLKSLSSVALGKAYAANEVAADATYKDQYLLVLGTVEAVRKDAFDNVVVQLRSSNQFMPVDARFDKTVAIIDGMEGESAKTVTMKAVSVTEAAGALRKGQKIRMLCKGNGMLIGSPQLKLCDTISR